MVVTFPPILLLVLVTGGGICSHGPAWLLVKTNTEHLKESGSVNVKQHKNDYQDDDVEEYSYESSYDYPETTTSPSPYNLPDGWLIVKHPITGDPVAFLDPSGKVVPMGDISTSTSTEPRDDGVYPDDDIYYD